MRIILYMWGGYCDDLLHEKLRELGHEVALYHEKCRHYTRDLEFAQKLILLIHESNSEAVISYNFFPMISMVCHTAGIPYYSWVYDSPHHTLFAKAVANDCNHIGCFDGEMVSCLNKKGINTVRHVPLGIEWSDSDKEKKYNCDISFVGGLYTNKYNYYDNMKISEHLRDRADGYIMRQRFVYDRDELSAFFQDGMGGSDQELIDELRSVLTCAELMPGEDYYEDVEYIFRSSVLEKKVTVEERRILLESIAETGYDFRLYTGSELSGYPSLRRVNRGCVDYDSIMPLVFRNSKINLNITLRSIHTGIPLRALDILGCGGFLLSNYQEELSELFEEDREVVFFRSMDECIEKIEYYIKHDDEREQIAMNGKQAVKERFGFKDQLEKLLSI